MPRIARMIITEEKSVYHVMPRTALGGFRFGPVEKDAFVRILKKLAHIYFAEVLGYAVMDNHFHLLIKMLPGHHLRLLIPWSGAREKPRAPQRCAELILSRHIYLYFKLLRKNSSLKSRHCKNP